MHLASDATEQLLSNLVGYRRGETACRTDLGLESKVEFGGMTMVERAAALPDPNERLVRVFATEQESEALVVRGLLESAGIDCQIGESENSPDVLPLGGVGILVREEDAERARQLIAESQRSPAQEQEEEVDFDEAALEAAGENDVSEESQ
jgi:hypothetical protein